MESKYSTTVTCLVGSHLKMESNVFKAFARLLLQFAPLLPLLSPKVVILFNSVLVGLTWSNVSSSGHGTLRKLWTN